MSDFQKNVLPFPNSNKNESSFKKERKEKLKKRFYAFFADIFIIGMIDKVLWISYFSFANEKFQFIPHQIKSSLFSPEQKFKLAIMMTVFSSYFLFSLFIGEGKTIGKHIFGLRVLSKEGSPYELSFMEAFMRTTGYLTCYTFMFLPFITSYLRKDMKSLPDFFSQTEVLTDQEFSEYIKSIKTNDQDDFEDQQLDLFKAS